MTKRKNEIEPLIRGNGKVQNQGTAGLGVSNMKERIKELEGRLSINTDNGYEIAVKIPA